MIKKLILLFACISALSAPSLVMGEGKTVDVNTASQFQLESINGIGPKRAQGILEERQRNGPFKSAEDLKNRVSGIGAKSLEKLQAGGLVVGKVARSGDPKTKPSPKKK
jgi:competence protein ComEA